MAALVTGGGWAAGGFAATTPSSRHALSAPLSVHSWSSADSSVGTQENVQTLACPFERQRARSCCATQHARGELGEGDALQRRDVLLSRTALGAAVPRGSRRRLREIAINRA